jgi:hypothetical protein
MTREVLCEIELDKTPAVLTASISSVKDWISNKSCQLCQYFLKLGTYSRADLLIKAKSIKQRILESLITPLMPIRISLL